MTLLPDGDNNVSSDWQPVGTVDAWDALTTDNGATSYVKCNDANETMIIEYANPSVAEADIDTITSVRFLSSGRSTHRTTGSRVLIDFAVPSGNPSEGVRYDPHPTSYETINGAARLYSDGSSAAWTYSNLEALELTCTKVIAIQVYLSYLALEVTYTEAVSADNATFFGANF